MKQHADFVHVRDGQKSVLVWNNGVLQSNARLSKRSNTPPQLFTGVPSARNHKFIPYIRLLELLVLYFRELTFDNNTCTMGACSTDFESQIRSYHAVHRPDMMKPKKVSAPQPSQDVEMKERDETGESSVLRGEPPRKKRRLQVSDAHVVEKNATVDDNILLDKIQEQIGGDGPFSASAVPDDVIMHEVDDVASNEDMDLDEVQRGQKRARSPNASVRVFCHARANVSRLCSPLLTRLYRALRTRRRDESMKRTR